MSNEYNWNQMNQQVIETFHATGGKIEGASSSILLLHTHGAKSNQPRTNPLAYFKDGDHYVIIASKNGAPTHPDWYYNIVANPNVTLEVGTEEFKAHATIPERGERDRIFADVVKQAPNFGEYQNKTSRLIPVVVLERINEG